MLINRLGFPPAGHSLGNTICLLVLTFVFSSCAPKGPSQSTSPAAGSSSGQPYDFGQNWDPSMVPASPEADFESTPSETYWVLVLATFTNDQHMTQAQKWLRDARTLLPELSAARTEPHRHGTMVVWGRYNGWDDARVEPDREQLLAMEVEGRQLFRSAMLKKIEAKPLPGELSPFDLRSARVEFPTVVPLYTLDVAVWVDLDNPQGMDRNARRRRAESYASQLRSQNKPAYFHHNEDLQMSSVTVGLFDRRALDPSTGLRSIEVDELANQFPARLLNGAPLETPMDATDPSQGTYRQRPFLVEVPE